ncbi:MAG: ABC transporter permease subunit [Pirellulales bacterium]|nr:ABC transporter permease subunit [Pirellulales bacterium]
MFAFLLRRLGWAILTVWIVYTVTFFLMRSVPGGPFDGERQLPEEVERNLLEKYNLNDPVHIQYFNGIRDIVANPIGEKFGPSIRLADYNVDEVIAQGFPVSASLGIFAMVFALLLGMTSGVISAIKRNSALDVGFMAAATLGISVPSFVLASVAVIVFVFWIPIFPAAGWGQLSQILLPALCLGAPFAGYIARLTRTGMLEVLGQDYIRTAYAKGLATRRVVVRHALRGAILPVVSYLGPAVAGILTGSLIVERIFYLPGMGSHFIEAALQRDYPLAMGMVLVYTCLLYVMNTLVDISYGVIDPRVKVE